MTAASTAAPEKSPLIALMADGTSAPARIAAEIGALGSTTAEELARRMGLARSTISTALSDLHAREIVVQSREASGKSVGRPTKRLSLAPTAGTSVGIHLRFEDIDIAVLDVAHNILRRVRVPLGRDYPPEIAAQRANEVVQQTHSALGLPVSGMVGVGVSVSAPVTPDGVVHQSSILPALAGSRIAEVFCDAFNCPVLAENEANCAAIAELTWGDARELPNFVLVKCDLGFGGAIALNGQLVKGVTGAAGEIGHVVVERGGSPCRCGNRGCLETRASFAGPLDRINAARGTTLDLPQAVSLALAGDAEIREAIREAADWAGYGLSMIGTLFDPQLIVVSGHLAAAGELFMSPLRAAYDRAVMIKPEQRGPDEQTLFRTGSFLEEDSLRGAAALVLHSLRGLHAA